ncbi:MAG TPA: UDP-N-acetylmuramoyl-L-alanyl-D-glutamate--2,6-diaminopimelate ligase [Candidatus Paceibacterota bacterium]|nr:UDP-N-acetylmuramoyl-L-alanyl-D-glutamate--2,6-diaminopimelate ligase [Candidatus Paceibacterota bacterium]
MLYQIKKIIRKITPKFVVSWYHYFLVFLAALIYHFPSRHLVVIGITGTKGKTTVAEMLSSFLERTGKRTAMVNSLRFKLAEKSWSNNLKITMPGRFFIQKFLYQAWHQKIHYAIVEVTSEGIKQHRHKFIDFDVAVLTNLQPEHLEAHGGSMEKYRQAKEELFVALGTRKKKLNVCDRVGQFEEAVKKSSIVNIDDQAVSFFLRHPAEKKIGFGLKQKDGDINELIEPQNYSFSEQGIAFALEGLKFVSPLKGEFNLLNILAAIAAGKALNIPLLVMKEAIAAFDGLPGRLEEIRCGQDFKVFVDYAHTPDSLIAVYETMRKEAPKGAGRLICVLGGTGGGRDKWKRPAMGKIASQYCDEIIITNEDPYDENPRQIMEEVAVGAKLNKHPFKIIEDRRGAINEGLGICKKGDCFIITGKGSEQVMVVKGGQKVPWDDRKEVREILQKVKKV